MSGALWLTNTRRIVLFLLLTLAPAYGGVIRRTGTGEVPFTGRW